MFFWFSWNIPKAVLPKLDCSQNTSGHVVSLEDTLTKEKSYDAESWGQEVGEERGESLRVLRILLQIIHQLVGLRLQKFGRDLSPFGLQAWLNILTGENR